MIAIFRILELNDCSFLSEDLVTLYMSLVRWGFVPNANPHLCAMPPAPTSHSYVSKPIAIVSWLLSQLRGVTKYVQRIGDASISRGCRFFRKFFICSNNEKH